MPDYRLYHFAHYHIDRAETLSAPDDAKAVEQAAKLADGHTAELWRGARKLKTFNPTKS